MVVNLARLCYHIYRWLFIRYLRATDGIVIIKYKGKTAFKETKGAFDMKKWDELVDYLQDKNLVSNDILSKYCVKSDLKKDNEKKCNTVLWVLAIIGAVGVIILAKNVMEFAQAYQQQDSSSMNSALKGIVAGLIMAGISAVMTFLGF